MIFFHATSFTDNAKDSCLSAQRYGRDNSRRGSSPSPEVWNWGIAYGEAKLKFAMRVQHQFSCAVLVLEVPGCTSGALPTWYGLGWQHSATFFFAALKKGQMHWKVQDSQKELGSCLVHADWTSTCNICRSLLVIGGRLFRLGVLGSPFRGAHRKGLSPNVWSGKT